LRHLKQAALFEAAVVKSGSSLNPNYRVLRQFWQGKFAICGLILSSRQFLLVPQLPQNFTCAMKIVKNPQKYSTHLHQG
jgi:hypothetical protein